MYTQITIGQKYINYRISCNISDKLSTYRLCVISIDQKYVRLRTRKLSCRKENARCRVLSFFCDRLCHSVGVNFMFLLNKNLA